MKKMHFPQGDNGYFRTGLPRIQDQENNKGNTFTYEIEMKKGSILLNDFPKIDYIKIDIEGYEEYVLPELAGVIEKHKPMLQVETWGTHKQVVFALMEKLNYSRYSVYKNKLVKEFDASIEPGDYLFIHKSKEEEIIARLKKINRA